MKALQEQLNELKAFRSKEINPKVKKVEQTDSVSTITHIRGSLLGMHPVALFLLLANKLPFINRITKRLQAYYGRTSIWRMLVIFRKIFIAMNAVIGVYTVFRLTGLSTDTILANFIGMGVSYIEILSNFTRKLFHWIFDFFDYKVVPNVPKDNGWWGGPKSATWAAKPMVDNGFLNLAHNAKDNVPSIFNIKLPNPEYHWYTDWSKWLWIVGGVTLHKV